MGDLISPCPHCRGAIVVRLIAQQGGIVSKRASVQSFEFDAQSLLPAGAPVQGGDAPNVGVALSPGEKRTSRLYHRWTIGDVWTALAISGVWGILISLLVAIICIAAKLKAHWPPIAGLGTTTIIWLFKSLDFFIDKKAIVREDDQERIPEPAPVHMEPPAVNLEFYEQRDRGGGRVDRVTLKSPRSNPQGLAEYCAALAQESAFPSWEGGESAPGAKQFGYQENEFNAWRQAAVKARLLEKIPGRNQGYRVTERGQHAFERIGEQELQEASYGV